MDAPICCEVLVMADVTPTSSGSAFWVAVLMQGTIAIPSPRPSRSSVGSTWVSIGGARASAGVSRAPRPSAAISSPGTTSIRVGTWGISRLANWVAASAVEHHQRQEGDARS